MSYLENILVCLALPLLLAALFTRGATRRFALFAAAGMGCCLLGAYTTSFFMLRYGVDASVAAVEVAPVCEEAVKLVPVLFYLLVMEPDKGRLPAAAVAVAAGFATFENVCYLAENGAGDLGFLLVRGLSAGALHILCGVVCGYGLSQATRRPWLALTGTLGVFGFCTGLHGIYNLLVTAEGAWRTAGHLLPSLLLACLLAARWRLARQARR